MRVRTCLVVVCLLFAASRAFAQQQSQVEAGVLGGATWFQPLASDNTGDVNFNVSTGWAAGIFIATPPRGHISLQQEVQFAVKRTELPVTGGVLLKQRFMSIDVPIFVRLSTAPRGSTAVHVLAGPALTFRTAAKQTTITGGSVTTQDVSDQARKFDIALAVGGGVDVGRWLVDVRYMHGLRNVLVDQSNGASAHLRTMTVLTGVRF